jgi:uncharacterized protein YyaL (SSP411 family)
MNLDLLFYAAAQSNDKRLYEVARSHAETSRRVHIRPDNSTAHVINFDPNTDLIKARLTNQGMAHGSCWSTGQARAIAGFVETYQWTHDATFLHTAQDCADYFITHLADDMIPP